jgi:hypothetical protein
MDSGGADGRGRQRNQKKTLEDFRNEKPVDFSVSTWTNSKGEKEAEADISISLFHYLNNNLTLDTLCEEFNNLPCEDRGGDLNGKTIY